MARQRRTREPSQPAWTGATREWIGGRFTAPFYITGAVQPYRPTLVAWLELPEGFVVGHDVCEPAKERGALGRVLLHALRHPLVGPPRRPSAIRVANSDLVDEVKAVVGGLLPVTVGATPEIDGLADAMFQSLTTKGRRGAADDETVSYFENGRVSPAAVADLFAATLLLRHAAPWETISDENVLRLDIPELGVEGACVSIIGALGQNLGFLIFPSRPAFDAFLRAASNRGRHVSRIDLGTSWLSLSLVPRGELPAPQLREVGQHGWRVADPMSYPQVEHRDRDGLLRPLTESDIQIASVCAGSLSAFIVKNRDVLATNDCEPIRQSITDDAGRMARFTFPYEAFPLFESSDDLQPATTRRRRSTRRSGSESRRTTADRSDDESSL